MFKTDEEKIKHALQLWANYIETGNINMSAVDAKNIGAPERAISSSQMKLIDNLRSIAKKKITVADP